MEYKVAIIGPKNVVSGFKALGVTSLEAQDSTETLVILKKIKKDIEEQTPDTDKFASVLVIESLLQGIPEEDMARISSGALPAIVALPGIEGSQGAGIAKLKKLTQRAIGSDILG